MDTNTKHTRELLIRHYNTYPQMQIEDVFKFLYQSSFGCEHLVSDYDRALNIINSEYESSPKTDEAKTEPLDGKYSRVHLSWLDKGLKADSLARLFCLSAKKETDGKNRLLQKLEVAKELVARGDLPFDYEAFEKMLLKWRSKDFPAIHHSDTFRSKYSPAYRVIDNKYADFLELFSKVDTLLGNRGSVVLAIEGGSASGKSTLSSLLEEVYDCNVIHADDFFLRPEQRTTERFEEIGGNFDRERFYDEVVKSLIKSETVSYRSFDCSTQRLSEPISLLSKKLTVIEGVYSTHPALSRYFDLALFLDIDPKYQRERIIKRNTPQLAERFFNEWIPLEKLYFEKTAIKERCDLIIPIHENSR